MPDTVAFNACNGKTENVPTVERDIAAARELQARRTPAILVNDKRFPVNPSTEQLVSVIEEELRKEADEMSSAGGGKAARQTLLFPAQRDQGLGCDT